VPNRCERAEVCHVVISSSPPYLSTWERKGKGKVKGLRERTSTTSSFDTLDTLDTSHPFFSSPLLSYSPSSLLRLGPRLHPLGDRTIQRRRWLEEEEGIGRGRWKGEASKKGLTALLRKYSTPLPLGQHSASTTTYLQVILVE
jgi:hypothetical protein